MKVEDGAGLRGKSTDIEIETSLKLELGSSAGRNIVLMMMMMRKLLLYAY